MPMTGIKNESESAFQAQVIKYIEKRGGYVIKVHVSAYQKSGEPDLIVCYKGRFISFELKSLTGKARALQLYKRQCIIDAGGIALVTKTMKEVEDTLDEIFRIRQDDKS